jgi:hypothetical protein
MLLQLHLYRGQGPWLLLLSKESEFDFFFVVLKFELRAESLLGSLNPFCFGYFLDRVLCFCPSWSQPQSYLSFPHSWDDRHIPPMASLMVEMGSC